MNTFLKLSSCISPLHFVKYVGETMVMVGDIVYCQSLVIFQPKSLRYAGG